MSVQNEITRISNNVQNTIDVIEQTGVSVPAGANSDNLPSLAQALANEKQDKLTGTEGQFVGFDSSGAAVALSAPTPVYRTVTLTTSAWASNTQTVTVSGVLVDETAQLIQPMPAIASQDAYISAGIICSSQAVNQLTFKCSTVPTDDISLYVVITEVRA